MHGFITQKEYRVLEAQARQIITPDNTETEFVRGEYIILQLKNY
jgi:hypothetical protein